MKASNFIVALIILALIALPGKYAYFEIDNQSPAKTLAGFIAIIIGVMAVFIIDMRSQKS